MGTEKIWRLGERFFHWLDCVMITMLRRSTKGFGTKCRHKNTITGFCRVKECPMVQELK
jgi:hypothetical protein